MSKICLKHQCFKKGPCRHKARLGYLILCRIGHKKCPFCAPHPYGRYEPEDILLP